MKVKNLFKSLAVVALIVPFLFGLTACGKGKSEVKTVAATEVYETFRTALVSYNQEQTEEPNKFVIDATATMQMLNIKATEIRTMGLNLNDQQFFSYSSSTDENDNEDICVTFVRDVENAKRVYVYKLEYVEAKQQPEQAETPVYEQKITKMYQDFSTVKADQEKSEWETFYETATQDFSTEVPTDETGYPASSIEITEQTTFEEFQQMFVSSMNGEPETSEGQPQISLENVKFSGKKYKDGSIGFVISVSLRTPFEEMSLMAAQEDLPLMTINVEYVVKDNQIVKLDVDSGYVQSMPDANGNMTDVVLFGMKVSANIKRDYDETKIAEYTADVSAYVEGSISDLMY